MLGDEGCGITGMSKCNFGFAEVVSLQLNDNHKQPFFWFLVFKKLMKLKDGHHKWA